MLAFVFLELQAGTWQVVCQSPAAPSLPLSGHACLPMPGASALRHGSAQGVHSLGMSFNCLPAHASQPCEQWDLLKSTVRPKPIVRPNETTKH
ncbi:hypothetical protein O6H91_10G042500 [Diphasiastrum complanatum]|uniref:Uncharacterized protein n=1 Tax=Diphasiastrum complanatum TaxID=34168 RepID=A0ACC2CH83_DIPCM|nr:hypothetical protein O6H91_10G042500 [Diphasiastrum complanatum]